ncbi:MAG: hypothetical protein JNG88_01930 [Phycisphaerales bacterium]|nr:hypothetical protein [Phycisphaerales bacterium]
MSCSVNLLPAVLVHARTRNNRARAWWIACGTLLTSVVGVWAARTASDRVDQRLDTQVAELTRESSQKAREIVLAKSEARQAIERLLRLEALLQYNRWPERYGILANTAPEGVFLAELTVKPEADASAPRLNPGGGPVSASTAGKVQAQKTTTGHKRFRIVGYAASHTEITTLLTAISNLPGCSDVQLVSAASDPKFKDFSIRFECAGLSIEGHP